MSTKDSLTKMKEIKNIRRGRIVLLQTVFIILLPLLNINQALSQESKSISVSDLKAGDSIYIITNREIDTTSKNVSFNCTIDENEELTFLKVMLDDSNQIISKTLNYDDFMVETCNKTSDWLLFVHGDGKTYKQSVQRGFDIQNTYNVNVIVFSWPSENPDLNGLKNFKNSEKNVLKSVGHFNKLLDFMSSFKNRNKAFSNDAKLSMLLHSLGNLYLEKLVNTSVEIRKDTIFDNLIMNSAAVNRETHEEWVEKLCFQRRIYITNNHYDFSLKGLHIYTKHGNQLGEEAELSCAKNAKYVHFTEAVGFRTPTSNTHTYFIGAIPRESENIRDFYYDVFYGDEVDFSDQSKFLKSEKGAGYDIVF